MLPASPAPILVLQYRSPGKQGVKRSPVLSYPSAPCRSQPPRLGSQHRPWPWPPPQFVRCFVSCSCSSVLGLEASQLCSGTGLIRDCVWVGGVGGSWGEKEGRRGSVTRGDPSPGCVTQSLPYPASCTPPPPPLHIQSQYKECESCSGQGSLNSGWRDCAWGCMGFEGTSKQAFQVMRLAFSAEPRGTHRTVVLSSVQLQGH